ncbi:hypothetical protein ACIQCJ_32845 [Streptomyces sp. NPDC093221]|uniref:hypothetical protein n=1 Tax=Streptomyces sp. NPDC093221 TaxID=3366032 RepID=UPI00382FD86B
MELNDGGVRRRGRGALFGAVAGLVAVAAVTAGAVVALGSSSGHADASVAPPARPSAAAAAPTTGAATPSTASPTAAARVPGRVSHGVHTGDLRFFLLPAPSDADVYGDPDGSPYTADDIAGSASDPSDARAALKTYGFRTGAYRTYLTGDGAFEVSARLIRFGSAEQTAAYDAQHSYQGARIPLTTAYPARAYNLQSSSAESTSAVVAVAHQGDVHITITLTGGKAPSAALVQRLLDAQFQRLKTGH